MKRLHETIIWLYLWTSCNERRKGAREMDGGNERPLLMMAIAFCTGIWRDDITSHDEFLLSQGTTISQYAAITVALLEIPIWQ